MEQAPMEPLTNNEKLLTMASSTVEARVAATVITLKVAVLNTSA